MSTPEAVQSADSSLQDSAGEEAVVAAAEALVADATAERDTTERGTAAPARPATRERRSPAKATSRAKESPETLLAMAHTVNALAESIATLAGTVEALTNGTRPPTSQPDGVATDDGATDAVSVAQETGQGDEQFTAEQAEAAVDGESAAATDEHGVAAFGDEVGVGRTVHLFEVLASYGKYVAMFIGAGLVSGSVVHFPLAPFRYLLIGAAGAVSFALASVFGDLRSRKYSVIQIVQMVASSLALALGIGMVSGGIQHFQDFPTRAAALIPIGLGLSVGAFVIRNGYRLVREHVIWLAAGAVWVLMLLGIGLNQIAGSSGPADHHGSEATGTTTITSTTLVGAAAPASASVPAAAAAPDAGHHEPGAAAH